MPQLDRDTDKVVSESQTIYNFVKSAGWGILKKKLVEKIINLKDADAIDTTQSDKRIAIELLANRKAASELYSLLVEFEGTASAHQSLMDMNRVHDDIILQVPDSF